MNNTDESTNVQESINDPEKQTDIISLNKDAKSSNDTIPQPPPPYSAFTETRKTFIILIVTMAGFLGPLSGNIYIPLLPKFQTVFHTSITKINGTVAIFMFIMAISPLLWASFADIGGRKTLYLISLLFFIVSNILLASIPSNIIALYILRILQAFGASSVMSVGAGTIADITEPKNRGRAISYFMLGPQLGPVFGPMLSVIAKSDGGSWRWIFGFLAILAFVIYIIIIFCLPETLRYLVGDGSQLEQFNNVFVKPKFKQRKIVNGFPAPPKPNLKNYIKILCYIPVLLSCINSALLFAGFYAMSVSFTQVLHHEYGYSTLRTSFSYVCPGVSLIVGSLISGRLSDLLKKSQTIPEHRIPLQLIGLLLSITGLILFGWSCQKHFHISLIYIATFLNGFGMTWVFVITTAYLTECFKAQVSTTVALVNMFRNLSAGVSSLVVEKLISHMGIGWCFTGLGLCLLISIGNVFVIMWKGSFWREQLTRAQAA